MDMTEIVLSSESDANAVLTAMKDLLAKYEVVTVADLLDLVGIVSTFNDNKIGWTNLDDVRAKPSHGGFILGLPPTKPIAW